MLRDVAMATNFGRQFAIAGLVRYNFGCMIASDTLFEHLSCQVVVRLTYLLFLENSENDSKLKD